MGERHVRLLAPLAFLSPRIRIFQGAPPPVRHGPDNGLSALIHRDVLNANCLLASGSVSLERLDLRRKGASKLIERALGAVLLRKVFDMH